MSNTTDEAREFLGGKRLRFEAADELWRRLKKDNELSLARAVIARVRTEDSLLDRLPSDRKTRARLCQQHAELTSKDPELGVSSRHDEALRILSDEFDIEDKELNGDSETLGIAGGICKRRWMDLGQYEDLERAAEYYRRGMPGEVGEDGYAHINAAFMQDLLGHAAPSGTAARDEAQRIREKILKELPALDGVNEESKWWNAATRAEAFFGLKRYKEAAAAIKAFKGRPAMWQAKASAQQLAALAHLREDREARDPDIPEVFEALMPGAAEAVRSMASGKIGLALSGGGFRASFYHLGVLARLAELDMLRHIDVLSCVSGGSIVGACYWLKLRDYLVDRAPLAQSDYVQLVRELIDHFKDAVEQNLRGQVQSLPAVAWHLLTGGRGALDSEKVAAALEKYFYAPLWREASPLFMHNLPFKPKDHDPALTGDDDFNPSKHNWLRKDKVPVLVLNATTVNTGHAWQFTPTWMGESPWATHPAADSVPRLEWHWYASGANWQIKLSRAVAASACVPYLFEPLRIDDAYEGYEIQLVDGGVHDNQGTVALLAHNCNVLIVSDAAGHLLLERAPQPGPRGLASYATRAMDTLMERVRLANYADLAARVRTKQIRGLMFLHMKDGLDADTIRLKFSQESFVLRRAPLSPLGVRKDFQKAVAELRTDLDRFTDDEASALMACGYRMSASAFERDLLGLGGLRVHPAAASWPFAAMLKEVVSTEATTAKRKGLLEALEKGSARKILQALVEGKERK